jgi:AraC-like DNA-binding protein
VIGLGRKEAEQEIRKNKIAGYYHHSYEIQKQNIIQLLEGKQNWFDYITTDSLCLYPLASQPLRSAKNSAICLLSVVCRAVADFGVDVELCFSISDYYINKLEDQTDLKAVTDLAIEAMRYYTDIVQEARIKSYSLTVMRSIRYIHQHLYETLFVKDIAKIIGINADYLSALFKTEVGVCVKQYIREHKLDEAKKLLLSSKYNIVEVAEMLGYSSPSHFTKDFCKQYHCSPKSFIYLKTHANEMP